MNRWAIVRENGFLQLLCRNLGTGEGHCCGHGVEREGTLKDMLAFVCEPGRCQAGDIVVLPDGEVLQFTVAHGVA